MIAAIRSPEETWSVLAIDIQASLYQPAIAIRFLEDDHSMASGVLETEEPLAQEAASKLVEFPERVWVISRGIDVSRLAALMVSAIRHYFSMFPSISRHYNHA